MVPPHREPFLSAHDHAFGVSASGHGHSLLSGLVPDAVHRLASVYGVDVLDFQLLPGFAARTVSAELAPGVVVSSISDAAGHRIDHHQHEGGHRSARWKGKRLRTNSKVQCYLKARQSGCQKIPQAVRMGPVAGVADWLLLRAHGVLRSGE